MVSFLRSWYIQLEWKCEERRREDAELIREKEQESRDKEFTETEKGNKESRKKVGYKGREKVIYECRKKDWVGKYTENIRK